MRNTTSRTKCPLRRASTQTNVECCWVEWVSTKDMRFPFPAGHSTPATGQWRIIARTDSSGRNASARFYQDDYYVLIIPKRLSHPFLWWLCSSFGRRILCERSIFPSIGRVRFSSTRLTETRILDSSEILGAQERILHDPSSSHRSSFYLFSLYSTLLNSSNFAFSIPISYLPSSEQVSLNKRNTPRR